MSGSLRSAAAGFALPLEAARLLARERVLWTVALVPALISLVAVGAAVAAAVAFGDDVAAGVEARLPVLEAGAWYTWLWIGPGLAGLWLAAKLALLTFAVLCLVAALLLASLIAAPFRDALSRRVELLVSGAVDEVEDADWRDVLREAARSVRQELARLVFFVGVWGALLAAGLVIPGAQLLVPPALTVFSLFFLALDYGGHTLDRRRLSFAEKRHWLRTHTAATGAYGAAAFVTCAVPVLNLVAMPILVVGGTLLVLRYPPR